MYKQKTLGEKKLLSLRNKNEVLNSSLSKSMISLDDISNNSKSEDVELAKKPMLKHKKSYLTHRQEEKEPSAHKKNNSLQKSLVGDYMNISSRGDKKSVTAYSKMSQNPLENRKRSNLDIDKTYKRFETTNEKIKVGVNPGVKYPGFPVIKTKKIFEFANDIDVLTESKVDDKQSIGPKSSRDKKLNKTPTVEKSSLKQANEIYRKSKKHATHIEGNTSNAFKKEMGTNTEEKKGIDMCTQTDVSVFPFDQNQFNGNNIQGFANGANFFQLNNNVFNYTGMGNPGNMPPPNMNQTSNAFFNFTNPMGNNNVDNTKTNMQPLNTVGSFKAPNHQPTNNNNNNFNYNTNI